MYAKIKKGWLEPDIFIYSVCVGGGGGRERAVQRHYQLEQKEMNTQN